MNLLRGPTTIRLGILAAVISTSAYADTFNFITPTGSTAGGNPVSASATVVTGAGTVTITLRDLLANPTTVQQLVSDFDIVLSNGATTGTSLSQSGPLIDIAADGTVTSHAGNPTGWQLNSNVAGGIQISALGGGEPADLIIGPPGAGGVYTAANSSIAGNGPHNPFINQTGTFTFNVAGVTTATAITSATFSFGTTAGVNVPGVTCTAGTPGCGGPITGSVPEPTSFAMLGGVVALVAGKLRRRFA